MKIRVGVSNRHIHLSEEDFKFLFGNDAKFNVLKNLSQDGEFVSDLLLTMKTDKHKIENVRVIGPFREKTQVEVSISDSYFLGICPPVRMSGNFDGAVDIVLCNEEKELVLKNACIVAHRHIHMNHEEAKLYNLENGDSVKAFIYGDRGGILNNILVKIRDNYHLEMHIDMDEANAFGIKNGDFIEVIKEENDG